VKRSEAAALLGISTKTLDKLRPRLSPVVIGERAYRYRLADVLRYLDSLASASAG
jgi:hypothetical protein